MKFYQVFITACAFVPAAVGFTPIIPTRSTRAGSVEVWAKRKGGSSSSSNKGFAESGRGFNNSRSKTYGASARAPIKDMIDTEGAMAAFFETNQEWSPLFRELASHDKVPAMEFLSESQEFEFHQESSPWKRLDSKPQEEDSIKMLGTFLDALQQSLIDIPVNEAVKEDEDDLNFLEEGRRLLCITRFHVLPDIKGGSVESFDTLFRTCWSELAHLSLEDEADTGSLIVLPNYDLDDLRRFTDMNLQRPLDWLGVSASFEVASMRREYPAIRLLHKLSDMPTEPYTEESSKEEE